MSLPTNIAGPFDVKPEDLSQINDRQAVELFHQLLVIEAAGAGIPGTFVDVPADINVPDGGIDAQVTGADGAMLTAGLISNGITCYQIKTGRFSASAPAQIRSLLVQPKHQKEKKQRTKDQLQPRVLHCFENGGTFVVVLFGTDLVGTAENHGASEISGFMTLIDPSFAKIKVRVLRVNQLCSAIKLLAPGMALRLNRIQGYDKPIFKELSSMAETVGLEIANYHTSPALNAATAQITEAADTVRGFQHVRILGDAGAGKTHLIYRALTGSQLRECVLYCTDPEGALESGPLAALQRMAPSTTIILIADDCDLNTAEELATQFRRKACQMLLVTVHNISEPPSAHNQMQVMDIPRLEKALVGAIFESYGIAADDANWLAGLCEGSPRAAHKLGQYIQNNPTQKPGEHLSHLDRLWDRLVCSPHNVTSTEGKARLLVMRTLALFRKVAWDTEDGEIVQAAILQALQALDPGFKKSDLADHVGDLKALRILQGERMLIISPMLLHIAMWKSWFDKYSRAVDIGQLRNGLNSGMQQYFDAMLAYATESKAATAWTDHLLGQGGMFASLAGFQSTSNASLFFAVAQANPKVALRRFSAALGAASEEERANFTGEPRRTAIERLEQLAVPAETFQDAAQCLLLLAEAENESWSNNATGVFISLFGLGSAEMATSELAPSEKTDYIRRILHSTVPARRKLVVQALVKSLDPFMSRMVIEEKLGLRRLPSRWTAVSFDELYDAYAAHLRLLVDAMEYLPGTEAIDAGKGLLGHVRNLIVIPVLEPIITAFLLRAASSPALRDDCIETIVTTLHYEGKLLSTSLKAKLKGMHRELAESSFGQRLHRHAGMRLLEDNFDAEGQYREGVTGELIALSEEVAAEPNMLKPELAWLVTDEAKNGFQLGKLLGQKCGLELLNDIVLAWIEAGEKRSDFFLGGYLSALHATQLDVWEELIEHLLGQAELRESVVSLIWRSGMSDRIAKILLTMAQHGEIDATTFRLFIYGGAISLIPQDVFIGMVGLLIEAGSKAVAHADAALEILDARLHGRPELFAHLQHQSVRMLNLPPFVEGGEFAHSNNMVLFHWNQMANRLLEADPAAGAELAARCIENFAMKNSVTAGFRPEPLKFLTAAAKVKPEIVWPAVMHMLEPSKRTKETWRLLNWLRGDQSRLIPTESGLGGIPASIAFDWIDGDIANRAWLLAEYCPPLISKPEEVPTFARALLERYGARDDVRKSLLANHFTGSWSGPASEYFAQKLADLKPLLDCETNDNVRMWLKEYRERLQHSFEHELELERRENEY
jgi:hypothetical protein